MTPHVQIAAAAVVWSCWLAWLGRDAWLPSRDRGQQ